jgi:ActR/RegA family two-component response regulator
MQTTELIVFEPDLLFSSRIESAAAKAGVQAEVFSNFDEFIGEAKQSSAQVALMNLDAAQGKLASLEGLAKSKACKFIGYYSHVNSQLANEARRFGVYELFSRGAFVSKLDGLLKEFSSG